MTVIHDINTLSDEELQDLYGIYIDPDDRSVWDTVLNKQFDSLMDWAASAQEDEEDDYDMYTKRPSRGDRFDDEY